MHSNRHHLFKEGSWLLARKLESFTRHSWMLLSFGEKIFHRSHCACHKTNCQLFHIKWSISLALRLVAHRLPQTASRVFTLSSWIQRSLLSIILFPQIWKLQNSISLGRSWKKCACTIPDGENLHEDSMYPRSSFQLSSVPQRQLSASARHSGTRRRRHGSGCGILHWQVYTISCAHELANVCVRELSTLPRRMSLPGLIVMTFRRLSSRRRLATLRDICLSGLRRVFAGFWQTPSRPRR